MNRKLIVLGAMLLTVMTTATAPVYAETGKDPARIEKLEERTRDLEERMAKVEASSNAHMGMMQRGQGMKDQGMKMGMDNHPMGQMPQQVPQQNPGAQGVMPQGGSQQQPQQGAGMPAGGAMGDM